MEFNDLVKFIESSGIKLVINEYGAATYRIFEDKIVGGSLYLKEEWRKHAINDENPAVGLVRKVMDIGKESGCKMFICNLEQYNPAKNKVILYLMHCGCRLSHNDGDLIVLVKEL